MWWFKEIVHVWHADHILGNSDPSAYNNEYQRLQILLKPPTPIFPFFLSLLRVFIANSQESVETAWEMFRAMIPALGQDPDGFYISSLISEVGRPCAALRYEGVSESNRHASSNKGEKKWSKQKEIEPSQGPSSCSDLSTLWEKNVVTTFGTTHLPTSQEDIKHPFGMCTVSAFPITSYRCGERLSHARFDKSPSPAAPRTGLFSFLLLIEVSLDSLLSGSENHRTTEEDRKKVRQEVTTSPAAAKQLSMGRSVIFTWKHMCKEQLLFHPELEEQRAAADCSNWKLDSANKTYSVNSNRVWLTPVQRS